MTSSPLTPSHPHPSKTLETPPSPPPTMSRHSVATPIPIPRSLGVRHRLIASTSPCRLLVEVREGQEDRAPQPPLPETLRSTVIPLLPNRRP
ncbi:hypothetical protein ACFX1X_028826 [Malus domestica]